LHTRYSKETLSEDLVFRQANPVMGGRGSGSGTAADAGAQVAADPGGVNNFQGRYIIRHYWKGAVACKDPRYENWGGPPGNEDGQKPAAAAKGLATAPR